MLFDGEELREIISRTSNEIGCKMGTALLPILSSAKLSSWIWTFLWASATGAAFDSCAVVTEISNQRGSQQRSD